jgi:hypothetical protein
MQSGTRIVSVPRGRNNAIYIKLRVMVPFGIEDHRYQIARQQQNSDELARAYTSTYNPKAC